MYRILLFYFLLFSFNGISSKGVFETPLIDSVEISREIEELKYLNRKAESSSDADTIIYYSRKAIEYAEEHDLSASRSLLALGDGYLQSGNHTMALECFTQAANNYDEENNAIGLATAYNYISNLYSAQQNYDNSITYLQKAINVYQTLNDSKRLADSEHNLAYAYYEIEKYDSALIIFSEAKEKYKELGNEFEMAYCIGNSGLVYLSQSKVLEAEDNLLEAIQILDSYGDEYAVIDFMVAYSKVLQLKGELRKAISYASRSYNLAIENNISEYRRDAAYRLSQLYEETKQLDSAYHYLELYYATRDSIKNLQTIQQMADLRTEFEVNQKQLEVERLTKRKTIQLIIISALTIIVILACCLIVSYRRNLKRAREFTLALEKRREQLESQRKELEELNKIKDKFFSIISHDLRSPINSLGGISFMIKESVENENYSLLWEVVDYIDKTTFSLSSLLDNLLNWAMFQQGKMDFVQDKIEMKPLVNEVVSLFSTFIISKNIQLKLKVKDDVFVYGEKNSIMTILRNLMSNSIKFTEKDKGISISCKKEKPGWVKLELEDQGVGIPKEKLDNLFRVGKNKSTLGTEKEKGLGLGLNLVYEFVTLNEGEIKVDSEVGVGTKFTILLKEFNK